MNEKCIDYLFEFVVRSQHKTHQTIKAKKNIIVFVCLIIELRMRNDLESRISEREFLEQTN
jgi:hypothetical protein